MEEGGGDNRFAASEGQKAGLPVELPSQAGLSEIAMLRNQYSPLIAALHKSARPPGRRISGIYRRRADVMKEVEWNAL